MGLLSIASTFASYYYNVNGYRTTYTTPAPSFGAIFAAMIVPLLLSLAVTALIIVGTWKIFTKGGYSGWKSLIGGYNTIIALRLAGWEEWQFFMFLIPFYNIYLIFKFGIDFAKAYGKETWFGVLLVIFAPIMLMILGLGDAKYVGGHPGTDIKISGSTAKAGAAKPEEKKKDTWLSGE